MRKVAVFLILTFLFSSLLFPKPVKAGTPVYWAKTYGGMDDDWATSVAIAPNGDIIVAGHTWSFGADGDAWVLRLDENGNVKWQKTYGGSDYDGANAVAIAPNGDIIVAGGTKSFGAGRKDVWVLRLPPDGDLPGCEFCQDSNARVGNSNAQIESTDAEVKTPNAEIRNTNAQVQDTDAEVKTQWGLGTLKVTSSPSGASVYVNGSYRGETPLTLNLTPGSYEVKLAKDGYENYTETVSIEPGKTASVSASLVAVPPSETPEAGRTSGGIKPAYLIAALIGLVIIGGAVRVRGGKSKPSPSQEVTSKPAPTPTKKPELRTPPKPIPGFPAELLDKYEPLEFLGEGGFAKVFKVKRKSDGKIIALKVSRLDEKARRFFLKEVKAWRLLDHKNIVKLYNAYDEPLPHLEIEFVDGVEINGEIIRDLGKYPKPVDEEKALSFIRGIAGGLAHAHGKQVYHRDLKPQNVLITSDLTPKITDWGLAKVGAVSTTATTTKGLTLLYAAPEQLDDETYGHTDARTDIYQLGLIFYELLTGKLPYTGTSPAVVMAKVINPAVKPKPPSHYNKALAKYDGIFEKLLAKKKEERYQSIEEFLKDLELMKKLDEERRALEREIEKTKTTMSLTTDSKELKKLMRQLVEQLSRNALLHAQLNDKAGLINALEDLKAFSKAHRSEIENAIGQFELMMRESVPISKSTLEELRVLLHKVQREVESNVKG